MIIEPMLEGYLVIKLTIEHPTTKLPVVLPANTRIRLNIHTGLAWIHSYQVKLVRHNYALIN